MVDSKPSASFDFNPMDAYAVARFRMSLDVDGEQIKALKPHLVSRAFLEHLKLHKKTSLLAGSDLTLAENHYKPFRAEKLQTYRHIMVFRAGGIGDLIFTYPALAAIKRLNPECRITYVTHRDHHSLLKAFEPNPVDALAGIPMPFEFFQSADAHLFLEKVIECHPLAQSLDAYALFHRHVFQETDAQPLRLPTFACDANLLDQLRPQIPERLVLIHPRANSPFRTVHKQVWLDLVPALVERGYAVGFLDSPKMAEKLDAFLAGQFPSLEGIYNLARLSTSLAHTLALCALADYAIGVDSSIINLFAATGKPCIGLYTCFPGALRLAPFPNATVIQTSYNGCGAMPCFHHVDGTFACVDVAKGGTPGCVAGFEKDRILEAVATKFK